MKYSSVKVTIKQSTQKILCRGRECFIKVATSWGWSLGFYVTAAARLGNGGLAWETCPVTKLSCFVKMIW